MGVIDDPRNYLPDTDGDGVPDALEATGMVQNAAPEAVDEQRGLLGEVLAYLSSQQGIDPRTIAEQAGVSTPNINSLNAGDLAQMTIHLARTHPEIVAMIAQRFPAAQQLLGLLTGGQAAPTGNGGGLLGGLLGQVLGGR
jgi:hypothetical protein